MPSIFVFAEINSPKPNASDGNSSVAPEQSDMVVRSNQTVESVPVGRKPDGQLATKPAAKVLGKINQNVRPPLKLKIKLGKPPPNESQPSEKSAEVGTSEQTANRLKNKNGETFGSNGIGRNALGRTIKAG